MQKRPDCYFCKKENSSITTIGGRWACGDCLNKFIKNEQQRSAEALKEIINGNRNMPKL